MQVKDFANVFALDGYWRYKRAEKKKHYTDKSMLTRAAVMRNWVVPLWGERSPRRLGGREIDRAIMGVTSELTHRPLAGATRNRILSVLSELYVHLIEEGLAQHNPVRDVVRCNSSPERPRGALPTGKVKALFPDQGYCIYFPNRTENI